MKEIKLRTWILWAVVLFSLGIVADYFFWHLLLGQQHAELLQKTSVELPDPAEALSPQGKIDKEEAVSSFIRESRTEAGPTESASAKDNFLETLQACAPEIAAQAIATPEALIEYLQKSVGVQQETVMVENYHLTFPDGSHRRVHVIASDNSNFPDKKEIRFYKLDAEGYPERIALEPKDSLQSLLSQGTLSRHELRADLKLKDGSEVQLERHDQKVFEFQYNNHGRILSCRLSQCQCP